MITTYSGMLKKMRTSADENNTVHYSLPIGDELVDINSLIGKEVTVTYSGDINCVHCNRKTKKSFNQGYCYPCLISLAQCDSCIISQKSAITTKGRAENLSGVKNIALVSILFIWLTQVR